MPSITHQFLSNIHCNRCQQFWKILLGNVFEQFDSFFFSLCKVEINTFPPLANTSVSEECVSTSLFERSIHKSIALIVFSFLALFFCFHTAFIMLCFLILLLSRSGRKTRKRRANKKTESCSYVMY